MCFQSCWDNLDSLLAYQTIKVVQLHDSRLGGLYYGMLALIGLFVVGYEILYSNDHFEKRDVTGTPRLNVQQPTVNGCNPKDPDCRSDFSSFLALPYCENYAGNGNNTSVAPSNRLPCTYADRHTLAPFGQASGYLLVPTRLERRVEHRVCDPSASNNFTCYNEYEVKSKEVMNKSYVADVERYTVLLSHSYQRDIVSGNSGDVQGYYTECVTKKDASQKLNNVVLGSGECNGKEKTVPIECLDDSCGFVKSNKSLDKEATSFLKSATHRRKKGRRARSETSFLLQREKTAVSALTKPGSDVYAISDGDVFTIEKLLSLAGVDLDDLNDEGELLRDGGVVLHVEARYNNLHPFTSTFGAKYVSYEYHVTTEPMTQLKDEIVVWNSEDFSKRVIENRHGVLIVVNVGGMFGFFSIANFLLMLATAAAMLGLATLFTDKLASFAERKFQRFAEHKFDNVYREKADGEHGMETPKGDETAD